MGGEAFRGLAFQLCSPGSSVNTSEMGGGGAVLSPHPSKELVFYEEFTNGAGPSRLIF